MCTKVIFLDVDGVFTSARTGWGNFDIFAVHFIRWVCEQSGARIVISSTWRSNHPLGFWRKIFFDFMYRDGDWRTPYLNSPERRGGEIKAWLEKHPQITDYLILDDDTDFTPEQMPHFIRTDPVNGLMFEHMMKIRDYFGITGHLRESREIYQNAEMFDATRGNWEKF